METPLHISGLGLLTPLGSSPWSTFRALEEGQTLADRLARCDSDMDPVSLIRGVGSISAGRRGPHDPTVTLGERAAEQALQEAGITHLRDRAQIPLVLATSKGAVTSLLSPASSHEVVTMGPHGYVAHHLARRLAVGRWMSPVAACASSLAALEQASRIIRRGEARHVLVVAVESSLLPLLILSYKRLGVLPPVNRTDYVCRPLDQQRKGFVLNEVAAGVVLSHPEEASTVANPSRPRMHLLGVRMANEAHHVIRSAPDAPALRRITDWASDLAPLDVIHPHATGTVENDQRELQTLAASLGSRAREVHAYAVKGALGHGLGASGLVSLVIAAMCGRCRRIPPMPWLESPIESPFQSERAGTHADSFRHHAVFAAGFGGHVGGAVIKVDHQ